MKFTAKYLPIFVLIFLFLNYRTLLLRRKLQTAIGDGRDVTLRRATRVHANFAEYVPITLLLIFFLEEKIDYRLWIQQIMLGASDRPWPACIRGQSGKGKFSVQGAGNGVHAFSNNQCFGPTAASLIEAVIGMLIKAGCRSR